MAPEHTRPAGRRWPRWLVGSALAALLVLVAGLLLPAGSAPPQQPIRFNHKVHVKQAKCQACHTTVTRGPVAGAPKLADCLDCHEGSQAKTPASQKEEAKLEAYAKEKSEIPWVRVWRLPANVRFSHRVHVAVAKVECRTCHGAMETLETPPTAPLKRLTMNDCIGCHEAWQWSEERDGKRAAPVAMIAGRRLSTDCNACHR
jgi:hypothetical protein